MHLSNPFPQTMGHRLYQKLSASFSRLRHIGVYTSLGGTIDDATVKRAHERAPYPNQPPIIGGLQTTHIQSGLLYSTLNQYMLTKYDWVEWRLGPSHHWLWHWWLPGGSRDPNSTKGVNWSPHTPAAIHLYTEWHDVVPKRGRKRDNGCQAREARAVRYSRMSY